MFELCWFGTLLVLKRVLLRFFVSHFSFALYVCDISVVELCALECVALDFNKLFLLFLLASAFEL